MQELEESGSSKLERRLYNCAKFVKGGETQTKIAKELNLNPLSLTKHLSKHQNPDQEVLIKRKFEEHMEQQRVKHQDVRQEMMEIGLQQLKEGEIKMNANALRGVAKDASDIEERNKDRQLKVLEMINAFASGELIAAPTNDTTRRIIEG